MAESSSYFPNLSESDPEDEESENEGEFEVEEIIDKRINKTVGVYFLFCILIFVFYYPFRSSVPSTTLSTR